MESEILKKHLENFSPLPSIKEIMKAKTVIIEPPKTSEILKKHIEKFGTIPSFRNKIKPALSTQKVEALTSSSNHFFRSVVTQKPGYWDNEIKDLEDYFLTAKLPTTPIKLDQAHTIIGLPLFIENTMATVKANNGNKTHLPYLERLQKLRDYLILNN